MGAGVGRWVSWYRTLRACTCKVWISWYRILRVRIYSVRILVSVALLVSVIIQMSSLGRAADGQHNYPVYLNCHLAHLASSPLPPSSISQTLFPISTDPYYFQRNCNFISYMKPRTSLLVSSSMNHQEDTHHHRTNCPFAIHLWGRVKESPNKKIICVWGFPITRPRDQALGIKIAPIWLMQIADSCISSRNYI